MVFLYFSLEDANRRIVWEKTKIAELNTYHDKFNTLPLTEEKATISLFRSARVWTVLWRSF